MREYKRRVWLGVLIVLSLLAGVGSPASILTGNPEEVALAASAPDLVIETITWSPETPSIGDMVTFTMTLRNQGSAQADSSHIAYYIDDTYQISDSVNTINPGATTAKAFTWTAQAGSHTIKAVADSNNSVTESDETNNNMTFAFSVLAPDLVIETITWSPENPSVGDQVDFTVTVKNRGNSRVRFSHVDLYVDGNSRGYRGVQSMDAGANLTATFSWKAWSGAHTVRAIADVLSQVMESDETNNDKAVTLVTAAPDLIIDTITWSPTNLVENATVTFTVTLKNQGSGKADHSYVALSIDGIDETSVWVGPINPSATAAKTFTWTANAAAHTVEAVADSTDRLMESDETNNTQTAALSSLAPDLIVQSITWIPSSPLIDHGITFTMIIKNQGKTAACGSRLYFYIDDYYKWQLEVPEINAGATVTKTLLWAVKENSHTIQAVADGENCVIEGNESNNTKTVTLTVSNPSPPDLIIQDIVWSPENPSIGDEVTFTVSIKNQGSGQARPSHVAYRVDDTYLTSDYVDQIAAGATAAKTFTWTAQAGSHTFKAVVDYNESVSESDETNNEKAATISTPSPDLVIQGITWSPTSPSVGDMVTFTMTVKNQGSVRAGHSSVAYYIDGSSRGYHNVQEIDASATVTTTFTWTAQADSHIIKVVADMENQVPENDESNNERTVTLPAPDLVIQDITWSPANPSENATVVFMVTLENQGSGSADASGVYFYIDGSSEGYERVGEMDAGVTVTKNFAWKTQVGSHTVRAVADGENQVTESDESNNERAVTFSTLPPNPAPASEPTPIIATTHEEQEAGVHLQDLSTYVPLGEDIVFSFRAVNTATNPVMTVQLVMQVPSGMSIISSEFVKGDKERYSASYTVEPGDIRQIEVHMRAHEEGSFDIMGDLSYYFAEDKSTAEHQILTLPVTVGTDEASAENSLLDRLPWKEVWLSWWFILAVVILIGIVIFFLLRSRQRAH